MDFHSFTAWTTIISKARILTQTSLVNFGQHTTILKKFWVACVIQRWSTTTTITTPYALVSPTSYRLGQPPTNRNYLATRRLEPSRIQLRLSSRSSSTKTCLQCAMRDARCTMCNSIHAYARRHVAKNIWSMHFEVRFCYRIVHRILTRT